MSSPTTPEYWTYNGTVLNTPWWNVTTWGGSRQELPLLRGQNDTVAYRAGQMWNQKQFDQRTVSMTFWTAGINQNTGQPSSDQSLDFTSNFYQLRRIFAKQVVGGSQLGQLTRRWYEYVDGSPTWLTATALAEVAGNMSPTMSGRTRADFTVDLLLADPFFYSAQTSQLIQYNGASVLYNPGDAVTGYGQSQDNGGQEFLLVFTGPLFNFTLRNETAGVSVTVSTEIAAGHTLTLDVMRYAAATDANVSVQGSVTHSGARPWMVLLGADPEHNPGGAQTFTLTSEGQEDSGTCTITWSPGYL
jgi:hypothetical protein